MHRSKRQAIFLPIKHTFTFVLVFGPQLDSMITEFLPPRYWTGARRTIEPLVTEACERCSDKYDHLCHQLPPSLIIVHSLLLQLSKIKQILHTCAYSKTLMMLYWMGTVSIWSRWDLNVNHGYDSEIHPFYVFQMSSDHKLLSNENFWLLILCRVGSSKVIHLAWTPYLVILFWLHFGLRLFYFLARYCQFDYSRPCLLFVSAHGLFRAHTHLYCYLISR